MINENGLLSFGGSEHWKYHPGDDLQWADPDFDDSGWHDFSPGGLAIFDMPDNLWDGYGWWRFTFTADSLFYAENWNLYYYDWGAAEVYLDGNLVQSYGNFSTDPDKEKTYTPISRIIRPFNIENRDTHTIAVRYSFHQANQLNRLLKQRAQDTRFGFGFGTHEFNEYRVEARNYSSFTAFYSPAVLFVLFLLHLMLYYKFREDRSNLLISILIGLLLISVISIYSPSFIDFDSYGSLLMEFIWAVSSAFAVLFFPYVTASIFRINKLKKSIWLLAGFPVILIVEFIFGITASTYVALFFYILSFACIGYICFQAYKVNRRGVNFVTFGVLGSLGLVLVYMFYATGYIQIPLSYFYIMIAFLYTLFPLGLTLFVADQYGYLFTSMEKEVSDRTEELQEKSNKLEFLLKKEKTEASANRIRAEIASMRSIEDLQQITPLIWKELKTLDVPFFRCGVFIVDEKSHTVHMHLSNPDGKALASTVLSYDDMDYLGGALEKWKDNEVFTAEWDKNRLLEWTQSLAERGLITSTENYLDSSEPPESLNLYFVPFNQGMLYVGSADSLSEDNIKSMKQLADAFSVAYARYEDFQRLEEKNIELITALQNLQAAQDQLVQQEKLASLGQLTAGIAHEIKNPLNFVNNFSEVSLELVEEAREEVKSAIRQRTDDGGSERSPLEGSAEAERRRGVSSPFEGGKNDEVVQGDDVELSLASNSNLILDILNDIEANLKKIYEHGSRADGIVKSMLQHSRGGEGKMEPTDLNALVKEYVNLSFHGMRAGKNPISVDIEMELDDPIGEVPMVAEDFSRVILNLCNNAFDAMREKLSENAKGKSEKSPPEGSAEAERRRGVSSVNDYHPKLTVRTKSSGKSITLEIEDNGPGIPEEIKEKILQPFFTTKKGTQGTGLGLSITNDIVKAHGGKISIDSKPDLFTRFQIELNVNS